MFAAYPFLRFTTFFILGILSRNYWGAFFPQALIIGIVLMVTYGFLSKTNSYRFRFLLSGIAMMILFLMGYSRLDRFADTGNPNHILYHDEIEAYQAIIVEAPEQKPRSIKLLLELRQAKVSQVWKESSGRVIVYADSERAKDLVYGDVLLVKGNPNRVTTSSSPGAFDYARFLSFQNTFHQQFVGTDFSKIGHQPKSEVVKMALELRQRCVQKLTKAIENPASRGIALALVLGVKEELSDELKQSYAATGAMHVLAVSGLHVGIVYGLVLFLFKRLGLGRRKGRWWVAAACILVLWSYAFLTGLSPSVLRAVTMFSFLAIGNALKRTTNIYNTLAVSAFVLLWYNPYLIMSVGFQLSYLAVFGIVYLQPRFYNLISIRQPILDKIWALTCVSFAAQIATGPLAILYFHQFPTYFWLTNVFIIPAAFLMLVLGIAVLLISDVPLIGELLGNVLNYLINFVNQLIQGVVQFPGSTIKGISIQTPEAFLLYALVVALILLFAKRRFSFVIVAVVFSVVFMSSQLANRSTFLQRKSISFLTGNQLMIDFQVGNEGYIWSSEDELDAATLSYQLEPKRMSNFQRLNNKGDSRIQSQSFRGFRLITFYGKSVLIIDEQSQIPEPSQASLKVDYLVLSKGAVKNLEEICHWLDFELLILDATNPKYLADRLMSQAEQLNLTARSVEREGYIEIIWKE